MRRIVPPGLPPPQLLPLDYSSLPPERERPYPDEQPTPIVGNVLFAAGLAAVLYAIVLLARLWFFVIFRTSG